VYIVYIQRANLSVKNTQCKYKNYIPLLYLHFKRVYDDQEFYVNLEILVTAEARALVYVNQGGHGSFFSILWIFSYMEICFMFQVVSLCDLYI